MVETISFTLIIAAMLTTEVLLVNRLHKQNLELTKMIMSKDFTDYATAKTIERTAEEPVLETEPDTVPVESLGNDEYLDLITGKK